MRGLDRLQIGIFLNAIIALVALLIDASGASDMLLGARVVALVFLLTIFWLALDEGFNRRGATLLIHVYCGITAFAWLGFVFGVDSNYLRNNITSILMTFFQNQIGLLAMIWVFNRFAVVPGLTQSASWPEYLAETTQRMSKSILGMTIGIYALLTLHRLSLGVVMSGTGGVMSAIGGLDSILLQLSGTVGAVVTILGWFLVFGKSPKKQILGLILLAAQIAFGFLSGRRALFELFILGGIIWVALRGLRLRTAVLSVLLAVLLVGVAGPFFLQLRNEAFDSNLHNAEASARVELLIESFNTVSADFDVFEAFSPDYADSVISRAGILGFSVEIQAALQDGWPRRYGEVFLSTAAEMVPRFIWPGKLEYLGDLRIEQKMQLWFGLPLHDDSPTLLTFAIADGGALGVIFYFVGFGLLLALLWRFLWTARFPLFRFWAAAQIFSLCFYVEQSVVSQLGAARFLLAFFIADRLVAKFAPRLTESSRPIKRVPAASHRGSYRSGGV